MITTVCKLSYSSRTVPPIVQAVQGDTGRTVRFDVTDFTIPAGAEATYFIEKPSGEAVYNAATISGNSILCELTAQSLAEPGENKMQVRVILNDEIVTSFKVCLLVSTFWGIDAIESSTEMNIFDKAVEQATEDFQTNAEQIVEEVIESIPSDYTALTEEVDELNERIGDVKSAIDKYGYYETSFNHVNGTMHSADADQIKVNIKSGTTYAIYVQDTADAPISFQIYAFYSDSTYERVLSSSGNKNWYSFTPTKDVVRLGFYTSDYNSTGVFTAKVVSPNIRFALKEELTKSDFMQDVIAYDLYGSKLYSPIISNGTILNAGNTNAVRTDAVPIVVGDVVELIINRELPAEHVYYIEYVVNRSSGSPVTTTLGEDTFVTNAMPTNAVSVGFNIYERISSGGSSTPIRTYDFEDGDVVVKINPKRGYIAADVAYAVNEIDLIKNGKIVVTSENLIQGSYNSAGSVVENSKRIRTDGFLAVNKGDILHFVPGENTSQLLFGKFRTDKTFIADSQWHISSANVVVENDGYIIAIFRNTSNTDIIPAQFDAEFEIRKYFANEDNNTELGEWQKNTINARHIPGDTATPLTILHFSDTHGDQAAVNRIVSYGKDMIGIDDYICTGDMVTGTATQIESWWPKNVMTCIGNHDAASYSSQTGYDWTALSIADRIAYYISPFETSWNIVRSPGNSYYYKDYATQKVRLIVLDSQIYKSGGDDASAQTAWLSNLLTDAISGDLHVVVAIHAPVNNAPVVDCSFSKYGRTNMSTLNDSFTPQEVVAAVATAITNGLNFVGYIVGHNHQDYIYKPTDKQLGFCITCAATASKPQWASSDQYRDVQYDAFNLVTIDTANTLVKIVRCGGANIDNHMRTRNAICFNYSTGEKVGEVL